MEVHLGGGREGDLSAGYVGMSGRRALGGEKTGSVKRLCSEDEEGGEICQLESAEEQHVEETHAGSSWIKFKLAESKRGQWKESSSSQ